MLKRELQILVSEFRGILKERNYNWDINQLHSYFTLDQTWDLENIKKHWELFFGKRVNTDNIDLYIHIPFCHSRCSYCPFRSWLYKNDGQVDAYVDYLIKNMRFFEKVFKKSKFQRLLIGGGTPNILNEKQLQKLMTHLYKYFSFTDDARKTFECNPYITEENHIRLLKHLGFNKVNFGVQSLNVKSLKINKREYQTFKQIKNTISLAKTQGFKHISIDLIVGLAGDTLQHFAKTFKEIVKLEPSDIIVHGLKPPDKKYLSSLLKMTGKKYFMDHYPKMIHRAFGIMTTLAHKYGYLLPQGGLDTTRWQWGFLRKDYINIASTDKVYTGEFTGCGSMLGLGINARSHIFGLAEYRQFKQPACFSTHDKLFQGKMLRTHEEMVKFILNHLDRNSNIPRKIFRQLFGAKIEDVFPNALFSLRLLKKIHIITNDSIVFSFHKPEEKYICALFFFREARLI